MASNVSSGTSSTHENPDAKDPCQLSLLTSTPRRHRKTSSSSSNPQDGLNLPCFNVTSRNVFSPALKNKMPDSLSLSNAATYFSDWLDAYARDIHREYEYEMNFAKITKHLTAMELELLGLGLRNVMLNHLGYSPAGAPVVSFIIPGTDTSNNFFKNTQLCFPMHLSTGMTIVLISRAPKFGGNLNILSRVHSVNNNTATLYFDQRIPQESFTQSISEPFDLIPVPNILTHGRELECIDRLRRTDTDSTSPAINILRCIYGRQQPCVDTRPLTEILEDKTAFAQKATPYNSKERSCSTTSNDRCGSVASLDGPTKAASMDAPCVHISANNNFSWDAWLAEDVAVLEGRTQGLNRCQQEAVVLALRSLDISCIHGPPGTGKTTTIISCLRQFVSMGYKILVSAMSNVAVDHMLELCVTSGMTQCLRLGTRGGPLDPACIGRFYSQTTLKAAAARPLRTCTHKSSSSWKKISASHNKERKVSPETASKPSVKNKPKKAKSFCGTDWERAFAETQIVFCTCIGAGALKYISAYLDYHKKKAFDVVIVDEAAQAPAVAAWIPILLGRRALLAGDHQQLAPVVKQPGPSLLRETLFETVYARFGSSASHTLSIQYRMHSHIMKWPSDRFYHSRLTAHHTAAMRDAADLHKNDNDMDTFFGVAPLVWLDTAGFEEAQDSTLRCLQDTNFNACEAALVIEVLKRLHATLKEPIESKVAIITPYRGQVFFLKELLKKEQYVPLKDVRVASVDTFQGCEREIILMSLVRSNNNRNLGFLQDYRRMNVAVTRAQRQLIIVGDSNMLRHDATLSSLYTTVKDHGEVLPAASLLPDGISDSITAVHIAFQDLSCRINETLEAHQELFSLMKTDKKQDQGQLPSLATPNEPTESLKRDGTTSTASTKMNRSVVFSQNSSLTGSSVTVRNKPNRFLALESSSDTTEDDDNSEHSDECDDDDNPNVSNEPLEDAASGDMKSSETTGPPATPHSDTFRRITRLLSDSELEDRLIREAMQKANQCFFKTCQKSLHLIKHECLYCSRQYCLQHRLPEVHGCKMSMVKLKSRKPTPSVSSAALREKLQHEQSKRAGQRRS